MTEEEKRAMIQFFGTVHAQAKQTDQMVVGSSNHLRPIGRDIQNQLERVLYVPPKNISTNNTPQEYIEPKPTPTMQEVPKENNIQEYIHTQQVTTANQLQSQSSITEVLERINSNLEKIASTFINFCNEPKKIKNTKQS